MSIFNGLLTGGILIGKVCQALSGGSSIRRFYHEESGVTIFGDVSSGGVTFYRKEIDGTSVTCAANASTKSTAVIVVPNEEGADGLTYLLPPLTSTPFAEAESPEVSPQANVVTGLIDNPVSSEQFGDPKDFLFKLAFSGLKIGKTLNIGSFKLSCTTTQLIIVSTQITALAMTYMYLNSNKGVSVSDQNQIKPNSQGVQAGGEQSFNVDFASLGIDPSSDLIDGQITLQVNSLTEDIGALSKVRATPFDAAELEYFSIKA